MRDFWLAFVPMFVAVDPIGILPLFIAITGDMPERRRRRVIVQSVLTALAVSLGFLAVGKFLLRALGVTIEDFLIAGGSLLFVLALADLVSAQKLRYRAVPADETVGAVPIGVPLIVGPAVLTTSLVLLDARGILPTVAAVASNVLIAGMVFWWSGLIVKVLGHAGTRVMSKLAGLILAALAVMFVRKGLTAVIVSLSAPP